MTLEKVIEDFEAQIKDLSGEQIHNIIQARRDKVLKPLIAEYDNPQIAVAIVGMFIIGAVLADGELAVDEYRMFSDTLSFAFGEYISLEKCRELLESSMEDCEQAMGSLADILDAQDFEVQAELIRVCVAILAVDGKITPAERNWLLRLVSELY